MSSKVLLDKRARVGALALVLVMGTAGLVSGFRSAGAATSSSSIVCPLAATSPSPTITTPVITIPRCPPLCPPLPLPTTTTPVTKTPIVAADPLIVCRCLLSATGVTASVIACPPPPPTVPPTTTSTTASSTIPIDGWAIAGVTRNRVCAGPTLPTGCGSPLVPTSDRVIISRVGSIVATTTSDSNGRFRVPVPPGTYVARASTKVAGASVDCPAQKVVVSGPPVPTVITLDCTIQLP